MSRSSALPINVPLIFEMHDLNGALFLSATFFSALSFSFAAAAYISIVLFTTIYESLESNKPDPNNEVLNLIYLLTVYWALGKSFSMIHLSSQISIQLNRLLA